MRYVLNGVWFGGFQVISSFCMGPVGIVARRSGRTRKVMKQNKTLRLLNVKWLFRFSLALQPRFAYGGELVQFQPVCCDDVVDDIFEALRHIYWIERTERIVKLKRPLEELC